MKHRRKTKPEVQDFIEKISKLEYETFQNCEFSSKEIYLRKSTRTSTRHKTGAVAVELKSLAYNCTNSHIVEWKIKLLKVHIANRIKIGYVAIYSATKTRYISTTTTNKFVFSLKTLYAYYCHILICKHRFIV